MRGAWILPIAGLIAAGCSISASPGSPGAGAALAYSVPSPSTLQYEVSDTTFIGMDMSGMQVDVSIEAAGTLEAAFESAAEGVTATIRYLSVTGRFANSMAGAIPVGSSDLPEPATLAIDRRGTVTFTSLPQATQPFLQVLGSESAFRRLFVRLPGRAVAPGTMWTDTVALSEDIGPMKSSSRDVLVSTLAGDTVVAGRRLLVIRTESVSTTEVAGQTQGFDVRQRVQGTSTAVTLWDPERRAVVERVESGTATGTMEMPAMGMTGIPLSLSSRSTLRLAGS